MRLTGFAFTDIGKKRANNEDAFRLGPHTGGGQPYAEAKYEFSFETQGPSMFDPHKTTTFLLPQDEGVLLAYVCDGVGGRNAGEVASSYVVQHLIALPDPNITGLVKGLAAVNRGMYSVMRQSPDYAGMGCTIAGIVATESGLIAFAVGDSTVFEFTGRMFRPLTEIHTTTGDYNGKLCRVMGCHPAPVDPIPSFRAMPLEPSLFLIATDGVIRHFNEAKLAPLFNNASGTAEMASHLRSMILETEAYDNFTAILLELHE